MRASRQDLEGGDSRARGAGDGPKRVGSNKSVADIVLCRRLAPLQIGPTNQYVCERHAASGLLIAPLAPKCTMQIIRAQCTPNLNGIEIALQANFPIAFCDIGRVDRSMM